jgi:hypothetical protein
MLPTSLAADHISTTALLSCSGGAHRFVVGEVVLPKATKKRVRKLYTKDDVKALKAHSKARTPVAKIAKQMKRSEGSLRQKALALGIGLGHQR